MKIKRSENRAANTIANTSRFGGLTEDTPDFIADNMAADFNSVPE